MPSLSVRLVGMVVMLYIFWNGFWMKMADERMKFVPWAIAIVVVRTSLNCKKKISCFLWNIQTICVHVFFLYEEKYFSFCKKNCITSISLRQCCAGHWLGHDPQVTSHHSHESWLWSSPQSWPAFRVLRSCDVPRLSAEYWCWVRYSY